MYLRCILPWLLCLAFGCGSGVAKELESPDTLWWESGEEASATPSTGPENDDPMAQKIWYTSLSMSSDEPSSGYESYVWVREGLVACEVNYNLSEPAPLDDCTACIQAWSFSRSEPSIIKNKENSCSEWGIDNLSAEPMLIGFDTNRFYYFENSEWRQGEFFEQTIDTLSTRLEID